MTAAVKTFGCRLNIWESEVISRHLEQNNANDTVVFNTCAVTAEAESRARQAIRKISRETPHKKIIVTGCAAQINPEKWQAMAEVDAVIGNHEKLLFNTWQRITRNNNDETPSIIGNIMDVKDTAPHMLEGFDGHTRAFLQIQQGCDHRCTFCIIPYGRGQNRSVAAEVIVKNIRKLAENNIAEIVLTGVDIASWGQDFDGMPKLGGLVRQILDSVPELQRLRLSSVDPAAIDDDLIKAFAEHQRLMPHLHLSTQHGDDLILKRMKRRHSRKQIIEMTQKIKAARRDVVFGGDMIAGFPTESEAAHAQSLSLITEANLTWLHIFPYSPRQGTPAARMPQQTGETIKRRAAEMRQAASVAEADFLKTKLGDEETILLESGGIGHTPQFAKAKLREGQDMVAGQVYRVTVTGVDGKMLEVAPR